ncbi:SPOR domain-containing protein [Granulicella rosea]|uniref:SPOR domain-containing protein n=1 Tax=Granulicella rosea TaxID=474952 RepID=UPI0015962228|nr:SPOR domain-containing protein [Granulicella rosea]
MNSLLDSDDELHETKDHGDREISLGTTMLLGIFFGLALICAIFFGFGYSMGRKSVQGTSGVASNTSGGNFGSFKPAPGRSNLDPLGADKSGPAVTVPYTPPPAYKPAPVAAAEEPRSEEPAAPAPAPITRATPTATAAPTPVAAPAPTPVAVPGAVSAMVQIAAVTHQEDADYLVSALKRRGYSVAIHTSPQDKFLHVQVGPFSSKKDAEAMKAKLLSDGFNAIVK